MSASHPPHDEEMERAVLAACLSDQQALLDAVEAVSPEEFYHPQNRLIAESIWYLSASGFPVDAYTVFNDLTTRGMYEKAGGLEYVQGLMDGLPATGAIAYHAGIVHGYAVSRRMLQLSNDIRRRVEEPAAEQVNTAMLELLAVSGEDREDSTIHVATAMQEALTSARGLATAQGDTMLVRSGIVPIDEMVLIRRGHLVVVAGAVSSGKSALILQLAEAAARRGRKVLVFSLELTKAEIGERMGAASTGIGATRIARGDISEHEFQILTEATSEIGCYEFYLRDDASVSPLKIRTKSLAHRLRRGLDLIIVDYLQIMRPDEKFSSREQQVSSISKALKLVARDLNVPIIVAAQLSRKHLDEKRAPELRDLRESGSIEADADIVLMIWRPDDAKPDTTLYVRKQRQGPKGSIPLLFNKQQMRFTQY